MIHLLLSLLFLVSCSSTRTVSSYNRKEWKHWIDSDHDCQDTRAEILIHRSLVPVKLNKKGCKVISGQWKDYYYNEVLNDPRKIDIDHLIPLKHAHETGAASWTLEKKESFANDPENLVITNRRYNRQKGAKTILEWMPVEKSYACRYAKDWMRLKRKYQLLISKTEEKYTSELFIGCHK